MAEKAIKVVNKNGVVLAWLTERDGLKNCYIENRQNGESALQFEFPINNIKYKYVSFPEAYFIADGRMYTIITPDDSVVEQRASDNATYADILAVESYYLLGKRYVTAYNSTTGYDQIDKHMVVLLSGGTSSLIVNGTSISNPYTKGSAAYALYAILYGSGWSVGTVDVEGTHDLETDKASLYDNIMEVQNKWGGIFTWDSMEKKVSLRAEEAYKENFGFMVKYKKNEKSASRSINNDIVTRLYVYGKDYLSIASVNAGKEYIDNFDYTTTIHEKILQNNEIENALELKAWGVKELEKLHKPRATLKFEIIDIDSFRNGLTFKTSDIITIDDELFGTKYTARVIYKKYNYFRPYECSAEVGEEKEQFAAKIKYSIRTADTINNMVNLFGKINSNDIQMSGTKQTLTSSAELTNQALNVKFSVIGVDGYARTGKTSITIDGLTVYDGALKIKNKSNVDVFYGDSSGNLYLAANITASGGNIAGYTINGGSLTSGAVGMTTGTYAFYAGNATASSAPFRVTSSGALYATNATIQGTIESATIRASTIESSVSYLGTVYADRLITSGGSPLSYLSDIVANLGTINAGTLTGSAKLDGVYCENLQIEVGGGNGLRFVDYGSRTATLTSDGSGTSLWSTGTLRINGGTGVAIGNPASGTPVTIGGTLNINSINSSGSAGLSRSYNVGGTTLKFTNGILTG